MLADESTTRYALRFVSSSYSLTKYRSVLPKARQSMCRISSPGPYCRCSANSTENPLNGLLCSPAITPSTTNREISSSRPNRARAVGSSDDEGSGGAGMKDPVKGEGLRGSGGPRGTRPSPFTDDESPPSV